MVLPLGVLLIMPMIYFKVKNMIYLEGQDQKLISYLSQNMETVSKDASKINSFDSSFLKNNVYILAENHGYEDVQNLDYKIFKQLNEQTGLRYYIAEMDSLRAKKLNTFLQKAEPDTALLKSVVRDIAMRIPQQSSIQLYDKWLKLHNHNTTLQDSLKFEVLGLDIDFNDTLTKISRDSAMILNLYAQIEKRGLQNEKFYGLFGFFHGLQSGIGERNAYPFAARLKRQTTHPQLQKIQTFACLTLESEMYLPPTEDMITPPSKKMGIFNVDGPILLTKGIQDLKAVTKENSISLFQLDKPNSPYKNSQRLAGIKVNLLGGETLPNNKAQATIDFYQNIILIRGSKSLSPLE